VSALAVSKVEGKQDEWQTPVNYQSQQDWQVPKHSILSDDQMSDTVTAMTNIKNYLIWCNICHLSSAAYNWIRHTSPMMFCHNSTFN